MFQKTVKKVDIRNPACAMSQFGDGSAFEVEQTRLQRVSVQVIRASEVTLRTAFDVYVDGGWGSPNVGARLVAVGCAKIDRFEIDGDIAIKRAARDIGVGAESLARLVKEKLNSALGEYQDWSADEERDLAELRKGNS